MATIDRGTRLTYAQIKAHFDGVALAVQKLADAMGDDFTSFVTTGYSDNTVLRDVDKAIDGSTTGLMGLASVNALSALAGPLDSLRKTLTAQTNAATTKAMVALGYGDYIKALMTTFATGYDDTYDNFWDAWAALYTATEYVPGEVCDIMNAVGIKTDPAYCYPPEHALLGVVTVSGSAAGTLTVYDSLDPLIYAPKATADVEYYIVARADGSPTDVSLSFAAARDEADTPTDTGATTFAAAPGTGIAAATGATTQASSHILCSLRGATLTVTNGESGDIFAIRVKTMRAMAFPT